MEKKVQAKTVNQRFDIVLQENHFKLKLIFCVHVCMFLKKKIKQQAQPAKKAPSSHTKRSVLTRCKRDAISLD